MCASATLACATSHGLTREGSVLTQGHMDALRLSAGAMEKKELMCVLPIVEAAFSLATVALESIKVLPCVNAYAGDRGCRHRLMSLAFWFAATC